MPVDVPGGKWLAVDGTAFHGILPNDAPGAPRRSRNRLAGYPVPDLPGFGGVDESDY